jgi:predicted nucleotidyltransferase
MKVKTAQQLMSDNLICKHYAGSHAYGTSLPTSDIDFRGIFVADPLNIRTPFYRVEEVSDTSEEDTKFYELNQFMKLAMDGNPNIMESLFVDKDDVTFSTPAYELLRAHANQLLSAKLAFTYSGYATSQLKRMSQSKKKVNYLPDLKSLCEMLQQSLKVGEIDEIFIETQCGDEVLVFMKEHGYLS